MAPKLITILLAFKACTAYRIDPSSQQIIDECGRARIFHGVNAVEKVAPYLPRSEGNLSESNVLGPEDAELLQGLGMNLVRLGVLLVGTLPSPSPPGVANATYLSAAADTVRLLADRGVATLVDLHQDVLSPYFCGESLPDWAVQKGLDMVGFNSSDPSLAFPKPLPFSGLDPEAPGGYPPLNACLAHGFFEYYMSFASEALWHAIYSQPEMQQIFATHWSAVASALQGVPGLLGYEMLNEPWSAPPYNATTATTTIGAETAASEKSLPPAFSDQASLGTFYDTLHAAVRAVDNGTLFFFEPLVLGSYEAVSRHYTTDFTPGGPGATPDPPSNRSDDYKNVLAYHSYCPPGANHTPPNLLLCKVLVNSSWAGVKRNLNHMGSSVGGMLTEFGAVGEAEADLEVLRWQCDGADALLQGWAYWTYKSFDDITTQNGGTETFFNSDGSLQEAKLKTLARTYARATAGTPLSMAFDERSGNFSLVFTPAPDPSEDGANACANGAAFVTEVFLHNTYHYPNGYTVSVHHKSTRQDLIAAGLASVSVLDHGNTLAGDWTVLAVATTNAAAAATTGSDDSSDVVLTIEQKAP